MYHICHFRCFLRAHLQDVALNGFSSEAVNNWGKKCPPILDNQERSAAHREAVQKKLSHS